MRKRIDRDHLFDEVFEPQEIDYFTCPPRCTAQKALNELCRYFLGDDYYVAMPLSQEQVNAQMVYDIENRYSGASITEEQIITKNKKIQEIQKYAKIKKY